MPCRRLYFYADARRRITRASCQVICVLTLAEGKARFTMLRESGVVAQNQDGGLEAVTPEEAGKRLAAMGPERQAPGAPRRAAFERILLR